MSLFELTRDMHHACEQHEVGQRFSKGVATRQEWADWLWAFRCLHTVTDPSLPSDMHRDAALSSDLAFLPQANASLSALRFSETLVGQDTTGAAYVLHGAHRSGGRVMAPVMVKRGFPVQHIMYRDPDAAQAWVKAARMQTGFATQARETFLCLLAVMDEISGRWRPGWPQGHGDGIEENITTTTRALAEISPGQARHLGHA